MLLVQVCKCNCIHFSQFAVSSLYTYVFRLFSAKLVRYSFKQFLTQCCWKNGGYWIDLFIWKRLPKKSTNGKWLSPCYEDFYSKYRAALRWNSSTTFLVEFLGINSSLLRLEFLSDFLPSFFRSMKCYSWIDSSFLISQNFLKGFLKP
jgi:hypothetical protein